MTEMDETSGSQMSPVKRLISIAAGGVLAIFAVGIAFGYSKAALAHGALGWKGVVVYLIAGLMLLAGLWLMRRALAGQRLASSPRMREYQIVMIATVMFGVVLGVLLQVGAIGNGNEGIGVLFDNSPISPGIAILFLASIPVINWLAYRWHQTADEHDQAAYNFGGMLSLYAYFSVSMGWWFGWRGGLLTEPNGVAIFWIVMAVWTAGWVWRRYR